MAQEDAQKALDDLWNAIVPRVTRMQKKLKYVLANPVRFLESFLKAYAKAVKNVAKYAKELGAKIGKAAVQKLLALPSVLRKILDVLKKSVQFALGFIKKILSLVKSKLDPARLLKTLKALIAQYAKHVRLIFAKIRELASVLSPLNAIFSIIKSMQMVLRLVFSWIGEVLGAAKLYDSCLKLAKTAMKMLKAEMTEVTKMVKSVNTTKLPA